MKGDTRHLNGGMIAGDVFRSDMLADRPVWFIPKIKRPLGTAGRDCHGNTGHVKTVRMWKLIEVRQIFDLTVLTCNAGEVSRLDVSTIT